MNQGERWFTDTYLKITSARYDPLERHVVVSFGDGDVIGVDTKRLVYNDPLALDWAALMVEGNFYLHIPALPQATRGSADIASSDIRAVTDEAYATHLARSAEESARRIGERVRALRKARGLTVKEVAERAGIAQLTITRIEKGYADVGFTALQKVLASMGYGLRDVSSLDDKTLDTSARA